MGKEGKVRWRRGLWKAAAAVFLAVFPLSLTGCLGRTGWLDYILIPSKYVPETVEVEGETYRTGFYPDELFVVDGVECTDERYEINRVSFHRAQAGPFDCLHAIIGDTANGELYCLDSQWEQARDYYNDPENYTYYCDISPDQVPGSRRADVHPIPDMDTEQFDALTEQIEGKSNHPFDREERMLGASLEADPFPKAEDFYYVSFYRMSNDGCFQTMAGNRLCINNGKLYYIRYQDGKTDLLHVIEIREDTARYFIDLINSLGSPYVKE